MMYAGRFGKQWVGNNLYCEVRPVPLLPFTLQLKNIPANGEDFPSVAGNFFKRMRRAHQIIRAATKERMA